jgi:hypothetical protein
MKRTIILISTVAILLIAASCIKRNSNSSLDDHRNYFSARFDNYFSPGETGLMIFLSDLSGNLLAEASLEGQNSVGVQRTCGRRQIYRLFIYLPDDFTC